MLVRLLPICLALAAPLLPSCQPADKQETSAPQATAQSVGAPEMVDAGEGEVQDLVREAYKKAKQDGRTLLVYIGAAWCEPCVRFADAVKAKSLPNSMAGLRFLKFDFDRDEERLERAGYGGRLLPRYIVPEASGLASQVRSEGSIKGEGGVADQVQRIKAMLGR